MSLKTLILGMGKTGQALKEFFRQEQKEVICFDDQICPNTVEKEAVDLSHIFQVIISPGISLDHPIAVMAKKQGIPVIGEMHFALQHLPKSVRLIAITGTNGKTTTTLLLTHILKVAGYNAYAVGNVGVPLISQIGAIADDAVLVVEVSSYQLETLTGSFFDAAVILNITPDHLSRHGSLDLYAQIKCHLQKCVKQGRPFWVYNEVAKNYNTYLSPGYYTYGHQKENQAFADQKKIYVLESPVLDLSGCFPSYSGHDEENILAVWALCQQFTVTSLQFLQGLHTFQKPAHRLEVVTTVNDVLYINDSKGTNLDAVIKGVMSISKPVILIAGGVHKGASYIEWVEPFQGRVKHIIAIGQAKALIAQDLQEFFPVIEACSLQEAVVIAHEIGVKEDVVLLSPGCASFDMFKDYAHRGNEFKKSVFALKDEKE